MEPRNQGSTPQSSIWGEDQTPRSLVDLINRVLDRGVVVGGDVTISLAGVDLVYLGLNALLTSVSTARETLKRDVGTVRPAPPSGAVSAPVTPRPAGAVTAGYAIRDLEPPPAASEERASDAEASAPGEGSSETVQAALAEVARGLPSRLDVDPESVQRDLARLVLTLVELLRRVIEHQAVRRMDDSDLTDEQVERMGLALQRLQEKLAEIREAFGLAAEDLDVDLGPLGKLY